MTRGAAVLVAAALFASGLAVGALGVHLFYAQKIAHAGGPPMPVGPMFERWLLRGLDLSEQQRREIREVLDLGRSEAEELRAEIGPRLQEMNRRTAAAIAEILTPEQRRVFEEQMARWERRQRRLPPPEGRPPHRRGPRPR